MTSPNNPTRPTEAVERVRHYIIGASHGCFVPSNDDAAAIVKIAAAPQAPADLVERVAKIIDPHAFKDPTNDTYAEARVCRAFEKARAALASIPAGGVEERLFDAAFKARWFVDAVARGHVFTDISRANARDVAKLLGTALNQGDGV